MTKTEDNTTIKLPMQLKEELEALKVDGGEPYAGVIRRLIDGKLPIESTDETVNLTLPRNVYRMMVMVLPNNISDQLRKGVR